MRDVCESPRLAAITLFTGLACCCTSFPGFAAHSPSSTVDSGASTTIVTDSAVPLAKGKWSTSVLVENVRFDRLSDGELMQLREADAEADLHSVNSLTTTTFSISHGITDRMTIGLAIPHVSRDDIREPPHADGDGQHAHEDREHDAPDGEIETLGDSSGIGDASLFGLWRVMHGPQSNTHLAILFGVKAPTSRTNERTNAGGRFETELQPGTGSWDAFMGLGFTHRRGQFTVDTSVRHTLVTEGSQDTDLGDLLVYNLGAAYSLSQASPGNLALDLVMELNGEWRDRTEIDSHAERDSGGHLLYLSPGVTLNGRQWSVSASVGYPIVDEPNGDQDKRDFRFLMGAHWNP